jgi:hypothetical protein
MKRDSLAEEQIKVARAYQDARLCGEPCPDCGAILVGMAHVCPDFDVQAEPRLDGPIEYQAQSVPPTTTSLVGEDHATFATFADVCARLEAHQRAGADLMAEYQAQLAKVSAMAARHAR